MNRNNTVKDLRSQTHIDLEATESRLRYRLSSISQLSQKFSQATCENEIITALLRTAINQTGALGASFVPFDDQKSSWFIANKEVELDNPEVGSWETYLNAPSVRSQCRICRKEHPVTDICPLLSNPFSEKTKIFCVHLRKGVQKLAVVNLLFNYEIEVDMETQDYLQSIGNTAALAISGLWLEAYDRKKSESFEVNDPFSKPEFYSPIEIQQIAILEERSRLAREIHDGLAQILGYVKLQLSQIIDRLGAGETDNLTNLVLGSYQAISDAYIDAREAIDDLHHLPSALDFATWLRQTIQEFGENFGTKIEISGLPGKLVFPSNLQLHLTRMVQEILSNIRKHAEAEKVLFIYLEDEQFTILEFHDDGIGFDAQGVVNRSQHGLRSLNERANIIDAELTIISQSGKGTTIQIRVPNTRIKNSI